MKQRWTEDELVEHFALTTEERTLLKRRTPAGQLGFALLLKVHQYAGRFPSGPHEIPHAVVEHIVRQLSLSYQALLELGRAVRTIFLCEYLSTKALRREIQEGLNVIELWNGVNDFIFFGKGGELATNRRESQEFSIFSLHLLQNCLVYINTLMIQQVLKEPDLMRVMTTDDLRGLTPLMFHHINPYGTFRLDMTMRLPLDEEAA